MCWPPSKASTVHASPDLSRFGGLVQNPGSASPRSWLTAAKCALFLHWDYNAPSLVYVLNWYSFWTPDYMPSLKGLNYTLPGGLPPIEGPWKMANEASSHASENDPVTDYMKMSVEANEVKAHFNILAGFFAWITLAGFITLPNTFTSLQASEGLAAIKAGEIVQKKVQNIPLLPLAGVLCVSGIAGTGFLCGKFRSNYIWLIARIFT